MLSAIDMNPDEMIIVGRIVAPHGVRGDLRIFPDTERPEMFKSLKTIYIGRKRCHLLSARPHKNVYIVHVEGVDDRNTAETLVHEVVEVPFSLLPKLEDGAYYYFQLIGLSVVTEDGEAVGRLEEVMETGANNVYVIRDGKKETLIPAIPSCVLSIDMDAGRMTVRLPEWI